MLDPDNWQRGYVVDSSSNVYRFENAGASSSDWSLITGNFGSLVPVVDLRTIELFTPTDFPGDDIVLIGGLGGVYRTLNPQDGPATIWTEFNNAGPANQLPKMIVKDLSYTLPTQGGAPFPGDLLLAGTWGRGAWTVDNLSAVIDEPPVLSVCGDEDYVNQDDVIRLVRNAANPLLLDVYLNSVVPVFTASLAAIQQINIFGVGGNDELIVDSTNGLITVPAGIRYDGDGVCPVVNNGDPPFGYDRGFDLLTLMQSGGDVQDTEVVSIGALPGSGSVNVEGPTGVQSIFFEELEPIVSDIAAMDFLVGADPALASLLQAANTIEYSVGQILVGGGRITVDSFEPIEFRKKENVTISAGAGTDWINLDNASPVVGLASLTVNGEAGGDTITLSNLPIAGATTVNAGSGDDLVDGSGVSVAVLTLTGNEGADILIGGGANDHFDGGDGDDLLIGGAGDNTYIGGSGFDTIGILGTPASNVMDVRQNDSTTLISTVDGDTRTDIFATMEGVRVDAGDGDDVLRMAHSDTLVATPGNSLSMTVLGGAPNASDRLTVQDDGIGDTVIYRKGADHRSGTVSVGPLASVAFEQIESFSVTPLDSITGGTGTDGNGRLVVFKPDPFESNDALPAATFLGGGATINVDPVIDPGAFAPLGIPGDEDWYQFVAVDTGTLDFQVYFEEVPTLDNGRAGLPGDGALSVLTFDSDGTPMVAGAPLTDAAGNVVGHRVTIPVVRNQTYYLHVAGATSNSVNVYNLSAILVEAPVPQLVDLVAATDSGRSDNDDVTNFDALINGAAEFDIVLDDDRLDEFTNLDLVPDSTDDDAPTAAADYGVEVFNNAVSVGFAYYVGANTWRFTATGGDLLEGHNNFISAAVWIRDPATPSVLGRGQLSDPLQVTLDTIAPPGTVILHPESDSGIWGFDATLQDDISSDKTPLLTGNTEANAIARVLINNALLGGTTVAVPLDGDEAFPPPPGYDGNYELQTIVVLPDGLNSIELFVEDLAGNGRDTVADTLLIFVDTEGPVIENVTRGEVSVDGVFSNDFATSLFAPKPSSGPDPLVHSIAVHYSDGPDRVAPFFYDPVFQALALEEGNYSVVGDANGHVSITDVDLVSVYDGPGRATAVYELVFAEPLPDDRFTLSVSDSIKDIAGNQLDGESNAAGPFEGNDEPQNTPPVFPTGDGEHGGEFLARFTIDSRPEIGVWAAGNVWVDTNGNWSFDPYNVDFTNRDIIYQMGFTSDDIFAGNFAAAPGDVADGFDKIAAYGRVDSDWRWLVDTDNDGVPNVERVDPLAINGLPVAGEFDGDLTNGDEVGVFTGSTWYFDLSHDFLLDHDTKLNTGMVGYPIVGDFDHDGFDDLGTWTDNVFQIDLANGVLRGWDGNVDFQFRFGFIGVRERPVAADMDLDGFDDLGLWVPDRSGVLPQASGEWSFLVSDGTSVLDRIRQDPITGEDVVDFTPIPFGADIYAQFGDEFALPVVGNFDPPVAGTGSAVSEPAGNLHTNLENPLDVNADGTIAPIDALLIINFLSLHGSQRLFGRSYLRSLSGC